MVFANNQNYELMSNTFYMYTSFLKLYLLITYDVLVYFYIIYSTYEKS